MVARCQIAVQLCRLSSGTLQCGTTCAWHFGLVWWHLVLSLMSLSPGGPGDPTCPCINATALLIGLSSLSVIPNRTDVTDFHSNLVPTDLQIG